MKQKNGAFMIRRLNMATYFVGNFQSAKKESGLIIFISFKVIAPKWQKCTANVKKRERKRKLARDAEQGAESSQRGTALWKEKQTHINT